MDFNLLGPLASTPGKVTPLLHKRHKGIIKYVESTKLPKDCILCTLDVSSLYTNIPTEDRIHAALQAIEKWKNKDPLCPPTSCLKIFGTHSLQKRFQTEQ